jgi:hypothetical protein
MPPRVLELGGVAPPVLSFFLTKLWLLSFDIYITVNKPRWETSPRSVWRAGCFSDSLVQMTT